MVTTKKLKKTSKPSKKKEIKEVVEEKEIKKEALEKAEVLVEEKKEENKSFSGKYFYGLGKRKSAVAQVRIYPVEKPKNGIMVNEKELDKYFTISRHQIVLNSPFAAVGLEGKFDVSAKVLGGGISAQAEAVRLGISRALISFDENLRKSLKSFGFLTRDPRVVERKKPGKKKARRSPQWAKR